MSVRSKTGPEAFFNLFFLSQTFLLINAYVLRIDG